jgi:hypothetical protein
MCEHSCSVHCIMPFYKEVHLGLVQTRMNYTCIGLVKFGDPIQIATIVAKYTSSSGLSIRIPHLEDEKVFGLAKCKAYILPRSKTYSHRHDW